MTTRTTLFTKWKNGLLVGAIVAALEGILLTVLLNVPWYLALSVIPGKPGNLPPLLIASLLFGALIGWLRQRLQRK